MPRTHLALTRTNGHPLAGTLAPGAAAAWDWIARTIAAQFNCLPDDVDYDEPNLVTVNGEAVATCHICVDNTRN